jgi:signal transduction histidine kinase
VTTHELRSPVTVLAGTADSLLQHWDVLSDSEREALLTAMKSGAGQLQRLFRDLLAAAKADAVTLAIEKGPVSLRSVLDDAVSAVRAAGAGGNVVVSVDPSLTVIADGARLAQALDNLLRNALRHGAPPVRVEGAKSDGHVTIRVSDCGNGVEPSHRPRLFTRFSSGDAREGVGLGLFIARSIARGHDGDASYEPPDGEYPAGSFVLTLPATSSVSDGLHDATS